MDIISVIYIIPNIYFCGGGGDMAKSRPNSYSNSSVFVDTYLQQVGGVFQWQTVQTASAL